MPNTYTQIHVQFVFAVKNRASLIHPSWKEELHKYITGIIQKSGHKLVSINCMPDHIHILVGMRPTQSVADLMQDVKGDSSEWINNERLARSHFAWQGGYGAFSYSKTDIPNVATYIQNQEEHHRKKNFLAEYRALLQEFEIDFNDQYLFVDPL